MTNNIHIAKSGLSLFQREQEWEQLEKLLESDGEAVAGDPELLSLVESQFFALQDKRDSFCGFLAFLESQQSMCEVEQERLEDRGKRLKAARERLEKLAIQTIRSLGKDEKDRWKKLEGRTSTLSLHKNPASVEVLDDAKIPGAFKTIAVKHTVPFDEWPELCKRLVDSGANKYLHGDASITVELKRVAEVLKEMLPCERCEQIGVVDAKSGEVTVSVDRLVVCPDCNGAKQVPRQVPGARLINDRVRLVRK